ncbi:MAG: cyclic nucleotide-binding domain-containing protein [Leptospiraceae bacterium]|nr:cyclic nucleotide-binding domain-containing protein [Leptospiraceae bacterium]
MNPKVIEAVRKLSATSFQRNHVVFNEGDQPDDVMYFVFKGEVGIFKKREDGEHQINSIQPGEFFGEMALIHNRPRLASARVVSESAHMAVMDRSTLLKLAGHSPEFLFYLLRYAIKRLLAAEDKLQSVKEALDDEKERRGR